MQQEGAPKFLKCHEGGVRGVAFSPQDRYIFCSGGCDGKVNVYSALRQEVVLGYQITTLSVTRLINGVRFTSDGSKILASTTARRVVVLDVEKGQNVISYDNCAYSGRERTGIASDPSCPNLAVTVAVNGNGLALIDLRMPLPLEYVYDLHNGVIRDVNFLHKSWPWSDNQPALITAGSDGCVKVTSIDGRLHHQYHANHAVNTVCPSPEAFNLAPGDTFYSVIMSGGAMVSSYVPDIGVHEILKEHRTMPVWKIRYTSNGSTLYTVSEDGWVRKYRRYPDHHQYLGKVYTHAADIYDMDISPYDEYVVTASKDKTVGVLHLGSPNHGFTQYSELT